MEAFPHSGAQLASVHPCKHASVMKKFIDRMESAQSPGESSPSSGVAGEKGKKKWGLGGMVRRVTGGPGEKEKEKEKEVKKESSDGSAEEASGLQVDFYLVIVSYNSRFTRELTISSSNSSLVSYLPSR
jgi:ubiquitin-like-conjugating enzyme ATG3